ncbi:MAG: hypothetical protein ACRDSH_04630 [Pseudonocardiaceae bacterium]
MLIILTVILIVLLIAVLAAYLFTIGVLLNRVADNLDDCLQNVQKIVKQAGVIVPHVERINQTGSVVVGALPLLIDSAERIAGASPPPNAGMSPPPNSVPAGVGYLDK